MIGETLHVSGERMYGKPWYLLLDFAVNLKLLQKIVCSEDFPGSPVVKTPRFHCRGHGFDPWSGN